MLHITNGTQECEEMPYFGDSFFWIYVNQLIDIKDQKVIHTWLPDINKINQLIDTDRIEFQHLERDQSHLYKINLNGEHKNKAMRMRMIIAGFLRYGEMDKISDNEIAFSCRKRHDGLIRLLTPYSRNISSVETMMAAEDMRGQMTTSTLGFSQT